MDFKILLPLRIKGYLIPGFVELPALKVGIIVSVLLVVFQPFGINHGFLIHGVFITAGYGLVTSLSIKVVQHYLHRKVNLNKKENLKGYLMTIILCSFSIPAYYNLVYIPRNFWDSYLSMLFPIIMISGVFLLCIFLFYREKTNSAIKIVFHSTNKKEHPFVIDPEKVILIKSASNYIQVFYLKNGIVQSHLIRNTLKSTEINLSAYPQFCRCHSSYIANSKMITKISKTGGKKHLELENILGEIPITRSFCWKGETIYP